MSKTYEITYMTDKEETPDAGFVKAILIDNKATIVSVNAWGAKRRLAYPIKKQDQAFYTTVVFDADPSAVKPIETALALNPNLLRSLIVYHKPGFFNRAIESDVSKSVNKIEPDSLETAKTETVPTPTETVTVEKPEQPDQTTAEQAPESPKKRRVTKKSTAEETKALDEKLDALLSEDITK